MTDLALKSAPARSFADCNPLPLRGADTSQCSPMRLPPRRGSNAEDARGKRTQRKPSAKITSLLRDLLKTVRRWEAEILRRQMPQDG